MVEAGVTDPDLIRENTGRITWTLDAGFWHHIIRANHYLTDNEPAGTYTYEDGRFTLYWGSEEVITARVDIAADGSIRFRRPARQPAGAAEADRGLLRTTLAPDQRPARLGNFRRRRQVLAPIRHQPPVPSVAA